MIRQRMPSIFAYDQRSAVYGFRTAVQRVINFSCIGVGLQGYFGGLVQPAGSVRICRQGCRRYWSPHFFHNTEVSETSRLELVYVFEDRGYARNIELLSFRIREAVFRDARPGIHPDVIACPAIGDGVKFKGTAWSGCDNIRHFHVFKLEQLTLIGIVHSRHVNGLGQLRSAALLDLHNFGQL